MEFDSKELEVLRDRLEDQNFCENFKFKCTSRKLEFSKWSEFLAFNVIPLYSELTGYKLDELSDNRKKKSAFKYGFAAGEIVLIEEFGKNGQITGREYILYADESITSLEFDEDDIPFRMKYIKFDGQLPAIGYMVDDAGGYWAYKYFCEKGRIVSLDDYSKNSAKPFVKLNFNYDEDGSVCEKISSVNGLVHKSILK